MEDLRSQVKHFKALASAANSEAGSEEEEEWEDGDDEEFAAAAVNHKRLSLWVSRSTSVSPTLAPVPTYLSTAKISQLSDDSACEAKHARKLARKTARHIARQKQIASYLTLDKSEVLYLKTLERVHFSNPLSRTEASHIETEFSHSSLLGPPSALKNAVDQPPTHSSILKINQNFVTRVNHASAASSDLPPMNWGTRTLHSAANIHLIPASTEFLETPYGLAIRSPAHNNSIAYLNKRHCVIMRPDAISGLSELSEKPYEFQDWKQSAATSGNIWKFNSLVLTF